MEVRRYKRRFWAVYSPSEELIAVCVYKKGAQNVVRLLEEKTLPASNCHPHPRQSKLVSKLQQRRRRGTSRCLRHPAPFYKRAATSKREEGNRP